MYMHTRVHAYLLKVLKNKMFTLRVITTKRKQKKKKKQITNNNE